MPWDRTVLTEFWVKLNKHKPWEWGFSRKLSFRSNSNALVIRFFREHQTHLHSLVAARLLVFTATLVVRLLVFKAMAVRGGWELDKLKCHSCVFLWHSVIFFLNKCSSYCGKPLVNFRSSKKVNFDHVFHCFCCFCRELDLWRPLLCYPRTGFS